MATRKQTTKVQKLNRSMNEVGKSIQSLIADRRKTHGDFRIQADISQALKRLVRGEHPPVRNQETFEHLAERWENLTPSQQEGLDMILHKVARALAGDPNFKDHWDDIGGYAARVAEEC